MASTFYYDDSGFYTAPTADGTITLNSETGGTNFATSSSVTNEHYIRDGSIANPITDVGSNDAIRFDFGSDKTCRTAAIHFNAAETGNITLWNSANATGAVTSVSAITDDFSAGWTVFAITPQPKRYYFFHANANAINNLSELLFLNKFTLPVEPSVGLSENYEFGTKYQKAYGNNEYVKSSHKVGKIITLTLDFLNDTEATNIRNFAAIVTNRYPFFYSTDGYTGTICFVRLIDPIVFKEISPDLFSCTLTLREIVN